MIHTFPSIEEAIRNLRNESGKDCISIILPVRHLTPAHKKDYQRIDQAVKEVHEKLSGLNGGKAKELGLALDGLAASITFNRTDMGIGVYVTDKIAFYTTFPFPVREYVSINTKFRLKELYMLSQYGADYLFLTISEKKARLFRGHDSRLKEIQNKLFPMEHVDDYEYAQPSRSSSFSGYSQVKSFEKDKRMLEKMRFEKFLTQVDKHLGTYLDKANCGFVVGGTKPHTAVFLNVTKHSEKLISVQHGGYDWLDAEELSRLVWPTIEEYGDIKIRKTLDEFREKAGNGDCAHGVEQVWNALKEGRVDTLIMEKEFDDFGYTPDKYPHLLMKQSPAPPFTFYPSVANELIDLAIDQRGKVVFVESGCIPDGEHVGSICRY